MAATNNIPAFFKFFDPKLSSRSLNIPLSFTLYMKGVLPDKALLRDKHWNLWSVKVLKISNEHLLEEGWVKFIADTGVSLGDCLVFQYDGGNIFDFKLLGPNACEKEYTATCSIKVKEEREEKEKEVRENADKEVKEEEIDVEEVGEEDIETDGMEVEEEDDEEDVDFYTVDEYSDEESEEEEKDDNDENYEEEEDIRMNMNASKKEAKSSRVHAKRVVTSTRLGNDGKAAVGTVTGRKSTEAEGLEKISKDLFRSGLLPSKTPYFISSLRPRNRNELYIPQNLIRDHNLNIPEEMIIRAEDGKEFISRIAAWGDGRKVVTDGWRAFCRWYFVKQDEKCLCVFMSDKKLQIYVLQFQAGKWMSRSRMRCTRRPIA